VRAEAALLWECEFLLPSGRRFTPLARAPWATRDGHHESLEGQPAHMRFLGGEFACVPFGIGGRPRELLPEWDSPAWDRINPEPHGHSSNLDWRLVELTPREILLRLDYPGGNEVDHLLRRLRVDEHAPALDLELSIYVRRDTRLPVGLHPIAKLPWAVERLRISADFDFGLTYPAWVPPGASRVAAGTRFSRLESVPAIAGGHVDYSVLPKAAPTEEMLMLCGVRAPIRLDYLDEAAFLRLDWDRGVLPSCLLWPSDRALAEPPWNGSFRGLGVEPIAAVFDAAKELTLEANPLTDAGVPTALELRVDTPCTIRYRIEAGDA